MEPIGHACLRTGLSAPGRNGHGAFGDALAPAWRSRVSHHQGFDRSWDRAHFDGLDFHGASLLGAVFILGSLLHRNLHDLLRLFTVSAQTTNWLARHCHYW